ncbi:MAG: major capsid protein [Nitrospirota bacterium]|nr:major capsid protein [Nitrospirota bacterium]
MDNYTTTALLGVIENLKRPQMGLLDMFFPTVQISDAEEIKFDVRIGKRRIAPFVSPVVEGKLIEAEGFETRTFHPAYVKPKHVIKPQRGFKRAIGERIGGERRPMDRIQAAVVEQLADDVTMIDRRMEVMASEILRTGKVTVTGDGYPTQVVDFLRPAGHTLTLAPGSKWGDAGVSPLKDIKSWKLQVLQSCGAGITDAVMEADAWEQFIAEPDTSKALDERRGGTASAERVQSATDVGLEYMGRIGGTSYWTYQDWYVDENDVELPILPTGTVILGSRAIAGVRVFGAIEDEQAHLNAHQYFPKSWLIEDPPKRVLMTQSAPLVVPGRPAASFAVTVL